MSPFEVGYSDGYNRYDRANPFDMDSVEYNEYENGYKAGGAVRTIGGLI